LGAGEGAAHPRNVSRALGVLGRWVSGECMRRGGEGDTARGKGALACRSSAARLVTVALLSTVNDHSVSFTSQAPSNACAAAAASAAASARAASPKGLPAGSSPALSTPGEAPSPLFPPSSGLAPPPPVSPPPPGPPLVSPPPPLVSGLPTPTVIPVGGTTSPPPASFSPSPLPPPSPHLGAPSPFLEPTAVPSRIARSASMFASSSARRRRQMLTARNHADQTSGWRRSTG
jgi:hypothetical protein